VVDRAVDHGGSHHGSFEHLAHRPKGLFEITVMLARS
jgi:hypothetical protein